MLISALGLCFGPGGIPWSKSIMSCWIMPSHFGSLAVPCRGALSNAYVPLPSMPNSSLFQKMNLTERFVRTSGIAKTRASSRIIAHPDASSSAASPPPRPSMCAETMYISPGVVAPTFVA